MTLASNSDQTSSPQATIECVMQTILDFLLPFFLAAAGGNPVTARAAIRQLIAAHNAVDATELDLAGRIVGFSIAALDNLRLSMAADLPVTRLLRYRGNAVSLSRASDQARKALAALRANPEQPHKTPRPSVAPAPSDPAPSTPSPSNPARSTPSPSNPGRAAATCSAQPHAVAPRATPSAEAIAAQTAAALAAPAPSASAPPASVPPGANSVLTNSRAADPAAHDIEAMKRDARMLMNAFSKHGASSAASMPAIADPATLATAAARAAVAAVRRPNPGGPQAA